MMASLGKYHFEHTTRVIVCFWCLARLLCLHFTVGDPFNMDGWGGGDKGRLVDVKHPTCFHITNKV